MYTDNLHTTVFGGRCHLTAARFHFERRDGLEKFRRRILVTSVVSKTPQMPKVGIFIHGMDGFANILPE